MALWSKTVTTTDKTTTVNKKRKPVWREWLDAGVFAIVAATLIRTFVFEAYTIPSGSMEGSLLIHDFLFVSKMAYGPRVPMTPLAVPLVHNEMPVTGGKSYSTAIQWGYHRLPGFGHIERNDVVVFNGPDGDTAIAGQGELNYYQVARTYGREAIMSRYQIITHPVDKKENLIKRCVGISGDVIEVKDGIVYVNGQQGVVFPHSKLNYLVRTNGRAPGFEDNVELVQAVNSNMYVYNITNDQLDAVKKAANVVSVELVKRDAAGKAPQEPGEWVFPLDTANFKWNRDNYGPITIPKAGVTVSLTPQNIALYRRIIGTYEGNKLDEQNGKIMINGKEATAYTFKMNYFWMMGDNRHNSLDSRYWGFVPDDHVVGKASFVWFSYEEGITSIRWKRLLRSIHSLEL